MANIEEPEYLSKAVVKILLDRALNQGRELWTRRGENKSWNQLKTEWIKENL